MNILLWLIFGALAGWLASAIAGSRSGLLINIILGIVGALIGGFIMSFFGFSPIDGFNLYSFIVAVIGALILIAIGRAVYKGA